MTAGLGDFLGETIRQRVIDQIVKEQRDMARMVYAQAPEEYKSSVAAGAAAMIVMTLLQGPMSRTDAAAKGAVEAETARIKA